MSLDELFDKYVALWNEQDAERRHELEDRAARAYEQFVAPGDFSFRLAGQPARIDDVVRFTWEMVSVDGAVAGLGSNFVLLAADGRIRLDYQFIES